MELLEYENNHFFFLKEGWFYEKWSKKQLQREVQWQTYGCSRRLHWEIIRLSFSFSALADMRYDLQDGEEKQREGLRARNWMFMCVCVYAQRYRGPQFARFLSHFTFRLRIGQHCFRSCASLPAYLIHKVVKSNDWNTVHFELSPWQRSHSGRNVKVPVLGAPPPVQGVPIKRLVAGYGSLERSP